MWTVISRTTSFVYVDDDPACDFTLEDGVGTFVHVIEADGVRVDRRDRCWGKRACELVPDAQPLISPQSPPLDISWVAIDVPRQCRVDSE